MAKNKSDAPTPSTVNIDDLAALEGARELEGAKAIRFETIGDTYVLESLSEAEETEFQGDKRTVMQCVDLHTGEVCTLWYGGDLPSKMVGVGKGDRFAVAFVDRREPTKKNHSPMKVFRVVLLPPTYMP